MSKRTLGVSFLVVGVLGFLLSLTADRLGIGTSAGLGWLQILGAVAGIVLAAWGTTRLRGS